MSNFRHPDLISLRDYTREDLSMIWETAWDLKRLNKRGQPDLLKNKTLAMIFNMPLHPHEHLVRGGHDATRRPRAILFPDRIWAAKANKGRGRTRSG